jgi:hypothetical protein
MRAPAPAALPELLPAHLTGPLKPRVRLAATAGEGVPLGASINPPVPAPLPDRGAPTFLLVTLFASLLAVIFMFLIVFQL